MIAPTYPLRWHEAASRARRLDHVECPCCGNKIEDHEDQVPAWEGSEAVFVHAEGCADTWEAYQADRFFAEAC